MTKALKFSAILAACAYVAFVVAMFFLQRVLIYPGARIPVPASAPSAPGLEVIHLDVPDARIEAFFLPASAREPQPVMIFAHGNGEVIDHWTSAVESFRARGIGVLLVEYPGYGRSTGHPSEPAIRATMSAAYDRIAADPRVDKARIFGFGQSLGGGAICVLSRDRPLQALILQSTFTSLRIFSDQYHAPALFLRDRFDNLAAVREFRKPILIIHGKQDRLIPWEQGQALANAAADGTFKLYDCGHGCWDPERLPFWQDAEPVLVKAGILRSES